MPRLFNAGGVIACTATCVFLLQANSVGNSPGCFVGNEIVTSHPCDDQSNELWEWGLLPPVPPLPSEAQRVTPSSPSMCASTRREKPKCSGPAEALGHGVPGGTAPAARGAKMMGRESAFIAKSFCLNVMDAS